MILNRFRWALIPLFLCFAIAATAGEREKVRVGKSTLEVLSAAEVRELGFKDYPDLARDKNAAYDYIAAMNLMKYPGSNEYHPADEKHWNDFTGEMRLINYPAEGLEEIFRDNAAMFAILEKIPADKQCAYPVDKKAQVMIAGVLLPHLGKVRNMVRLLGARACSRWIKGEKKRAVGDLAIGYQLATSLKKDSFMIGGLVQIACYSMLANITNDFVLSEKCDSETAKALLAILQTSSTSLQPTALWIKGESLFGKLTLKQMLRADATSEFGSLGVMPPVIAARDPDLQQTARAITRIIFPDLLIARDMDAFYEAQIKLTRQPYPIYHQFKKGEDRQPFPLSLTGIRDWDIFSRMMLPTLGKTHVAFLKCHARLRVAIGGTLLRLHQLRHKTWPKDTGAIPAFLTKELSDPFTDSKPLRYRTKGKGWILYSVGPDMKDDNGRNEGRHTQKGADDIAIEFGTEAQTEIF